MTITIPNIQKTYNNEVEYAFDKEGKFDTRYTAFCVEYDEDFCCDFYAPSTYTQKQLKNIGNDLAMGWGGYCISVKKIS